MAYRNTFFRWLFLYSLTFGLTYVLKLFTYLCPETGQFVCNPLTIRWFLLIISLCRQNRKDNDEDSRIYLKFAASRRRWESGMSKVFLNITSESQSSKRKQ